MKTFIKLSLLVVLVSLWSCKKEQTILGVNATPSADELNVSFSDTSKIFSYSKKYDSIAAYNGRYKFLGSNLDPYFGNMDVGMYLNSYLSVSNLEFSPTAFLTSAELIFVIDNFDFSGNPSSVLNYSLYTVDSNLVASRVYYSTNTRLHYKNLLHAGTTFTSTLNGKPVLRLAVDSSYAARIFSDKKALATNDDYITKYKGFYIVCKAQNTEEGAIFKCDLEDELSGFYLRYRAGTAITDTLQNFKFGFTGSTCTKFNTVAYDYKKAYYGSLKNQIQGDTLSGAENLFLKGLGGTRIKVYLPYLLNYTDSFKVSVNRAELVFNVDQAKEFPDSYNKYPLPLKLALVALDSLGKENYVVDQMNTTDASRYDGGYDSDNKRYVFNIARHVQAIFNSKRKNYGFHLILADPDPRYTVLRDNYVSRVILLGTNYSLRPKLNLSFIRFKKD